ncbi:MAG: methyl-accepting chemotaxis protein, partial [Helicobacteraceae bacterium]|nr:methyl-accepting chemotaxis protein [Helicobacteraceae bacterium]
MSKIKNTLNNTTIAARLNVVTIAALAVLMTLAVFMLSNHLSDTLMRTNIDAIKQITRQAFGSIEMMDKDLQRQVERLEQIFRSELYGGFRREEGRIKIGGIEAPIIYNGARLLTQDRELVDNFTDMTGAVATIFALDDGKFIRVSTSIRKEDGSRATGVYLGDAHPAKAMLLEKKPYLGLAKLFGREYMTIYSPFTDSKGNVIGALCIGLDWTDSFEALRKDVTDIKFGDSGFMYIVNAGGEDKGKIVLHPAIKEGTYVYENTGSKGRQYIKEAIEAKEGETAFWYSAGNEPPREKYMVFSHYENWDWIVIAEIDAQETQREGKTLALTLVAGGFILAAMIAAVISFCLNRYLSRPMKIADRLLAEIAAGNLAISFPEHGADEVGKLLSSMRVTASELGSALGDIKNAAKEVAGNSRKMLESSGDVAKHSEKQSDESRAIASGVEQMSATLGEIANASRQASKTAEESDHIASRGEKVIGAASAAMKNIADTVRSASSSIFQLGKESKEVNSIVDTIGEIADQT